MALKVKSGSDTAVTYFKTPVWSWADDGTIQVYRAALTYYTKTVVKKPKNVYIARNVFLGDYLGGMNTTFFRTKEEVNAHLRSFSRKDRPSLLCILEPYERKPTDYSAVFSLRGRFSDLAYVSSETASKVLSIGDNGKAHYVNFDWTTRYLSLMEGAKRTSDEDRMYDQSKGTTNLTVWRGMSLHAQPTAKDTIEYRLKVSPAGYFPERIYGTGMVRTWTDPFTPYIDHDWSTFTSL